MFYTRKFENLNTGDGEDDADLIITDPVQYYSSLKHDIYKMHYEEFTDFIGERVNEALAEIKNALKDNPGNKCLVKLLSMFQELDIYIRNPDKYSFETILHVVNGDLFKFSCTVDEDKEFKEAYNDENAFLEIYNILDHFEEIHTRCDTLSNKLALYVRDYIDMLKKKEKDDDEPPFPTKVLTYTRSGFKNAISLTRDMFVEARNSILPFFPNGITNTDTYTIFALEQQRGYLSSAVNTRIVGYISYNTCTKMKDALTLISQKKSQRDSYTAYYKLKKKNRGERSVVHVALQFLSTLRQTPEETLSSLKNAAFSHLGEALIMSLVQYHALRNEYVIMSGEDGSERTSGGERITDNYSDRFYTRYGATYPDKSSLFFIDGDTFLESTKGRLINTPGEKIIDNTRGTFTPDKVKGEKRGV